MAWSMLITRAVVYMCIGPVVVLGVIGIATQDLGYMVPILIVGTPAWAAAAIQVMVHHRAVKRP